MWCVHIGRVDAWAFLCGTEIKIDSDYVYAQFVHLPLYVYIIILAGDGQKIELKMKIIIFIIKFSLIAKPCELKRFHNHYTCVYYIKLLPTVSCILRSRIFLLLLLLLFSSRFAPKNSISRVMCALNIVAQLVQGSQYTLLSSNDVNAKENNRQMKKAWTSWICIWTKCYL